MVLVPKFSQYWEWQILPFLKAFLRKAKFEFTEIKDTLWKVYALETCFWYFCGKENLHYEDEKHRVSVHTELRHLQTKSNLPIYILVIKELDIACILPNTKWQENARINMKDCTITKMWNTCRYDLRKVIYLSFRDKLEELTHWKKIETLFTA